MDRIKNMGLGDKIKEKETTYEIWSINLKNKSSPPRFHIGLKTKEKAEDYLEFKVNKDYKYKFMIVKTTMFLTKEIIKILEIEEDN